MAESSISRTEEMLLLVVCKLQEDAYGVQIREAVKAITGKLYSIGGIYVPLDRLVRKGLLRTEEGHPTAVRRGRPRRRYRITGAGLRALQAAHVMQQAMWDGVPEGILKEIRAL